MFEEKIGINFDYVKTNEYGVMSLNKKLSEKEFQMIQDEVDDIYKEFLDIVAKGRNLSVDQVKKIAKGRVWIGEDAVRIGLVDELGGLRDAMAYAAKKAEIKKPVFEYYPKQEEDKFNDFMVAFADDEMKSKLPQSPLGKEALKMLEIIRMASQMHGVQARLPYMIDIR